MSYADSSWNPPFGLAFKQEVHLTQEKDGLHEDEMGIYFPDGPGSLLSVL